LKLVGPPVPGVTWNDIDDRIILFNPVNGQAAALNETASAIWRLADGSHEYSELIDELLDTYDIDRDQITSSVQTVVGQLIAEGFLLGEASG
jgi:hypothetical protein